MAAIKEKLDNLESELRGPLKEYLKRVAKQLEKNNLTDEKILQEAYPGAIDTIFLRSNGIIIKNSSRMTVVIPEESYSIDEYVDRETDLIKIKKIVDNLLNKGYK